ncbi:hypothetical protein [Streptomyces sp. NPDC002250]
MGSLIQDFAINVLSGALISLSGFAIRRLRRQMTRRRSELASPADTTSNE